jgi:uncharacterized protein (UPF0332 family)
MMMTTEGNDTFYFMSVCQDFVRSSIELRDAAELCENDEIKQQMVSSIKDDFEKMWAKTEGITVMLQKEDYSSNRKFIIQEIKEVTTQNRELAKKIKEKLSCLS